MSGGSHWHDMTGIQAVSPVAAYALDNKMLDKLPRDFYSSKNYTDFMINTIRKNRGDGKPFLAYLAFQAPHDPIHVPEPYLSKYRGKYDDGYEALKARRIAAAKHKGIVAKNAPALALNPNAKPWASLSREKQAWESRAMEAYAGMVENMDYHLGRVITFLKDIGEYDNTLIIFTSDNGPNPWYSDQYSSNPGSAFIKKFDNSIENIGRPGSNVAYGTGWASASAGPLNYFKLTTGEGGIRTPLIIAGPGVKGARKSNSFAYVTDIMPTVLELTGAKHPDRYRGHDVEPMRGRSLAGVISGKNIHTYCKSEVIGGEMMGGKWMRKGDYKAVLVAKPFGPGSWRLYNTASDPGETTDFSTKYSAILEELKAAWDTYAKNVGVVLSK